VHLSSDGDLRSDVAGSSFVRVIEDNGDASFCDTRLTTLVNEVGLCSCSHLPKESVSFL